MNTLSSFSGVSVKSQEEAKEFYTKVLGLNLLDEKMGLMFELPGGGRLFVYEKPDHVPASYTVLNLVVEDIDKAVDELAASGVKMEHYDLGNGAVPDEKGILRGRTANMGPDIAWFKDPSGNVLALIKE